MNPSASLTWHPLESLAARFHANLAALERRNPLLAERLRDLRWMSPLFIAAAGDNVYLGRAGAAGIEVVPDPMPAPSARMLVAKVFPASQVTGPIAVSGLGHGWLWDRLAKLPCRVDAAPGHRPPLYFLAGDVEQLRAVLHVLDWREFLADPRFAIFAGPDAFVQLQTALINEPMRPEPRACLRIDSSLPQHDLGALLKTIHSERGAKLEDMAARLRAIYDARTDSDWAGRFRSGRLRVLGITSRYTTFLQHSMRDWLAGLERLGHDVRLFIEPEDHLLPGGFSYTKAVLENEPDLIVIIDHYRAEIGPVPQSIPCVMWVQDRLPNIYSAAAGAAQGTRDYCLGFSRLHLSSRHGYPAEQFMSATIGINEARYASASIPQKEADRFACDVSYVSHASVPSDQLVSRFLGAAPRPEIARLVWDMHDRMVAHFESGGQTMTDPVLQRTLLDSASEAGIELAPADLPPLMDLFGQQVNNAIFRHQALIWAAGSGADLRLYGRGWEAHPKLGRYARGEADNRHDLPRIYRASKVNLQVIPHGAVHQRMLDGLSAGGFFLCRRTPGDMAGEPYLKLWQWCRRLGISDERRLREAAAMDPSAQQWIAQIDALLGYDTAQVQPSLYECLEATADNDFMILAAAVWPELYPQVSFATAAELQTKLALYLADASERARVAAEMRRVVIERCSYLSISRRLVAFVGRHLSAGAAAGRIDSARAAA
jgi:hypothetical protein